MFLWLLAPVVLIAAPRGGWCGDGAAARSSLEQRVRSLIARYGFPYANVAVAVVCDKGEVVVSLNADEPFKPASNQKLLITAAALRWLGADHVYETTILATGPVREGTIAGDVIIRGGGDPNISGRFSGGRPAALLETWAERLRAAGIRRIEGDLVGDDTLFDDVRFLPGWNRAQEGRWYAAQVSALSLNDNCIDLTIEPGAAAGALARVSALPSCPFVELSGVPRTVAGGETRILVHRESGTNRISISGTIDRRLPHWKDSVTVDDPALFFTGAFASALEAAGITLAGRPRKAERSPAAAPPCSDGALPGEVPPREEIVLVRHTSTLKQDLPVIHKSSQNLHAEILLKTLGARISGEGSVAGGEEALRRFLRAKGLPEAGVVIADGSGLAHENRLSALLLARLLHGVKSEPYFEVYRDSLAIAGEDGTLRKHFEGASPLRGKLFGKTGSIAGVSSLTGFIEREGAVWCFSILVNGFAPRARSHRELQERICESVYEAMAEAAVAVEEEGVEEE